MSPEMARSVEEVTNFDEANGPTSKCVQCVCPNTVPWLISFSLGRMTDSERLTFDCADEIKI